MQLFLLFICILAAGAFETSVFRLPRSVIPTSYSIHLWFDKSASDEPPCCTKNHDGRLVIHANVAEKTDKVVLHAAETIGIDEKRLKIESDNGKCCRKAFKVSKVDNNVVEIVLSEVLEAESKIKLSIAYTWQLLPHEPPKWPVGAFSHEPWHLLTQFEDTGARTVFPCFDEPSFKSTFNMTVTLSGDAFTEDQVVLSNMNMKTKVQNRTYVFELTTPIMSTYLVALAIPTKIAMQNTNEAVNGNYSVKEWNAQEDHNGLTTAQLTADAFNWMEQKTGIKYPVKKVDYAAANYGLAMENWGLIIGAPSVAIHEAVHGWFGNMVTCAWWDDIWLNEGLTSYYTWLIERDIGSTSPTMSAEKMENARLDALQLYATRALHDQEYVGAMKKWKVAYVKALPVLQMFHKLLGAKFEERLFRFLKYYQYANVNSSNFIDFMTPVDGEEQCEREMLQTFIYNRGAPTVEIVYRNETNEFLARQVTSYGNVDTRWTIPIWYKNRNDVNAKLLWLRKDKDYVSIPIVGPMEDVVFDPDRTAFVKYDIILRSVSVDRNFAVNSAFDRHSAVSVTLFALFFCIFVGSTSLPK